jgi:hypothetical protein
MSLQYFGVDAFAAAIDRSLDLAGLLAARVQRDDCFELMAPPSLGVVCFRRRFAGADADAEDGHNAGLVVALEQSGLGLVSSTMLRGRYALRACVLNHTTAACHIDALMDFLARAEPTTVGASNTRGGSDRVSAVSPGRELRPPRRRITGGGAGGVAGELIAGLAPFAQLSADDRARVAALARLDRRAAGESVVEQWDASLDFYVIVDGRVEILVDGETVNELAAGEFFGEVAALDWGAGYGYPRIATVRTLETTTLLTFPSGSMNELVRDHPAIERDIRRVAMRRLHGQER